MTTSDERVLVDTNVLVGATDQAREHHAGSLALLERHPHLVLNTQVIREYLVVATRPTAVNGLGLSSADALENVRVFRTALRLLPESRPVLPTFLELVRETGCHGKRLHDAYIVASALAHGVQSVATWNTADFALFGARVAIVSPDRV
jgi:predicted nucleic acid-binding protein